MKLRGPTFILFWGVLEGPQKWFSSSFRKGWGTQKSAGCCQLLVASSHPAPPPPLLPPNSLPCLDKPGLSKSYGADVLVLEARVGVGGAGSGRNPLTWGFHGAKGPFVAAAVVRQYHHGPHSLGGGGAKTCAGDGPDSHGSVEDWSLQGREVSTSILFSPTACPPRSYKAKQGEGPCLPCPANSRTTSPAASICTCHSNFYRADSDSADSACTSE